MDNEIREWNISVRQQQHSYSKSRKSCINKTVSKHYVLRKTLRPEVIYSRLR
jgi:hypothetical protein